MSNYLNIHNPYDQRNPYPNKDMKENRAGGYVFTLDEMKMLDRFLILGSDTNTYYSSSKELTKINVDNILSLINDKGKEVIDRTIEISDSGRAPKNSPAIFVMALAASHGNDDVRKYALDNMHKVCRISTHLFEFVEYCNNMRGWGRGLRKSVSSWYTRKDADKLVYQIMKYKNRNGWAHRDTIKLSHPKPKNSLQNYVFKTVIKGFDEFTFIADYDSITKKYMIGMNLAKEKDAKKVAKLIKYYDLPREVVPTNMLNNPEIWEALLVNMPYTALIRNLGKISSIGLTDFNSGSENFQQNIVNTITNVDIIKKSRIHPIDILKAKLVYDCGKGFKGSNTWEVNSLISIALEKAFYDSFNYITPTNKRHMISLDVSGSMRCNMIKGAPYMSAATVSAAMALSLIRSEENTTLTGFARKLTPIPVNKNVDLNTLMRTIRAINFGGTDCAQPMIYATENKIPIDVFTIWTDNETWAGHIQPFKALKNYRNKMGINAKLIVCGVTSTEFTIADPNDPGMLDIVGFDSSVPKLISEFSLDKI